jgi:radical SAM superfamily enzyme YgiQ (UPF0313 family)
MKVCLVFPPQYLIWPNTAQAPPLGVFLLKNALKRSGIDAEVIAPHELAIFKTREELIGKPRDDIVQVELSSNEKLINSLDNSDVLGISCDSFNYGGGKELIKLAKGINKRIKVIIGGVHGSILDEYVLKTSGADVVVRNEGEATLLEVLNRLELDSTCEGVPGTTCFKKNGNVLRNPDRIRQNIEQIMEYGAIQFDASLKDIYQYVMDQRSWKSMPYEYVKERMLNVAQISKQIMCVDNSFTIDVDRAVSLLSFVQDCDAIRKIQFEARVNNLTDRRILESISPEKVGMFQIGVESGYQAGLDNIRKHITVSQVEKVCEIAYETGLASRMMASLIIGFPWEGVKDCITTLEFGAKLGEKYGITVVVNWWIPSPSEMWHNIKSKANLDESMYDDILWPSRKDIFYRIRPRITQKEVEKINFLMLNIIKATNTLT